MADIVLAADHRSVQDARCTCYCNGICELQATSDLQDQHIFKANKLLPVVIAGERCAEPQTGAEGKFW